MVIGLSNKLGKRSGARVPPGNFLMQIQLARFRRQIIRVVVRILLNHFKAMSWKLYVSIYGFDDDSLMFVLEGPW